MTINSLRTIYFSPTGNSKKILDEIAHGINLPQKEPIELSHPISVTKKLNANELVLIGIPVYAGRVPKQAIDRLKLLTAQNTPTIIVVIYGNRSIDDALIELRNEVITQGFNPVFGGAFISKHAWNNDTHQIAKDRPDTEDFLKAKTFGESIMASINNTEILENKSLLKVPGNLDYRERKELPKFTPTVNTNLCDLNGKCVEVCPVSAIHIDDSVNIDENKCILCSACITHCPHKALKFDNPWITNVVEYFAKNLIDRKEPEFFFKQH